MLSYSIRPSLADAHRHPASITNGTSCSSESSRPAITRNNPASPSFHPHYAALPKTHEELSVWITKHHLKQTEAAEILMVSRPRVSDVVNQKTSKFTIDTLVEMLS